MTTIPVKTWPRDSDWSSWLKGPVVPPDHEITQINLIERVTVTTPDGEETTEETHRSNRGHQSSFESRDLSERHTTGRLKGPERHRSSSGERRRANGNIIESRISSEETLKERRHHRSSISGDRNKPLPPLPHERHTTGRITSHRQTEEHHTRSLDSRRHQRSGKMKSRGTSMHGQIFLQDGTPAPDSTTLIKQYEAVDLNDNGIGFAADTFPTLGEPFSHVIN